MILKTIFIIANIRSSATPTPTMTISAVGFITALTWVARTDKSGSAIVTSNPTINDTINKSPSFLLRVSPLPTLFPIGVIAMSAPMLKRAIPKIIMIDAIKKEIISETDKSIHN